MKLDGTFSIRAPPDRIFNVLMDPRELASCVDDPHTIEIVDADRFRGTLRSGVGPIRGTFTFSAQVVERAPPSRARIQAHGSGMGSAFDIDATMELTQGAGATQLAWQADVILSGAIASLGARLMQGTIDKKTTSFFDRLRARLEGA